VYRSLNNYGMYDYSTITWNISGLLTINERICLISFLTNSHLQILKDMCESSRKLNQYKPIR
jgi:hypothetical protein